MFVDNKSPLTCHDAVMPPIYCNELGVEFTLMVSMPLAGGDFHQNTKAFVLLANSLRRFHMNEKAFVLFAHKLCLSLGAVAVSRRILSTFFILCNFWGNKCRVMPWQQGITWCNDKGRPIQWQACQYSQKLCLVWVCPTQRCFTKQNAHPGAWGVLQHKTLVLHNANS